MKNLNYKYLFAILFLLVLFCNCEKKNKLTKINNLSEEKLNNVKKEIETTLGTFPSPYLFTEKIQIFSDTFVINIETVDSIVNEDYQSVILGMFVADFWYKYYFSLNFDKEKEQIIKLANNLDINTYWKLNEIINKKDEIQQYKDSVLYYSIHGYLDFLDSDNKNTNKKAMLMLWGYWIESVYIATYQNIENFGNSLCNHQYISEGFISLNKYFHSPIIINVYLMNDILKNVYEETTDEEFWGGSCHPCYGTNCVYTDYELNKFINAIVNCRNNTIKKAMKKNFLVNFTI